jgi:hypothetical protein
MPSFRFQGFTTGSLVAITAVQGSNSAQASVTWGQPGGGGQPNATFTISRVDNIPNGDMIAPFPAWFRATNLSGFSVSEPSGDTNVYDPTQHRITFIWSFGDPGYVPARVPNIPTVWRDYNVGYGRQVCHVYPQGGIYTVTCFAFDDAGNWGTATFTTPTIQASNDFFTGARTIVFSKDAASNSALWAGEPPGSTRCTTEAAVRSAINTRIAAGDTLLRVLLRRGETYNDMEWIGVSDAGRGLHWGAYGTGNRPIINQTTVDGPFTFVDTTRLCSISEIDWRGPYDATKEIGRRVRFYTGTFGTYSRGPTLFHRCKFAGYDSGQLENDNFSNVSLVFHDVEYTNWRDFGWLIFRPTRLAMIGCDGYQHVDALNGINHESGNSNTKRLGNGHGPIRIIQRAPQMYIACSSFFSRNGWSVGDPTGIDFPPSGPQPAFRDAPEDVVTERCYRAHDRNTFEGGDDILRMEAPPPQTTATQHRNTVFDKCLFVASTQSSEAINNTMLGMTARNCYVWVPNRTWARGLSFISPFKNNYTGTFDAAQTGPVEIYNTTTLIEATTAQIGVATRVVARFIGTWPDNRVDNNVLIGLNLSPAIGNTFTPIGSAALSGFTPRFKGTRWNFPPIGSTTMGGQIDVTTVRELSPGGTTPVANTEWVRINYPNYNGRCKGAGNVLNPVTRTQVVGNSSQYHQVSITSYGPTERDKALAPASAGGTGKVLFDFPEGQTYFRIQNLTGVPWSSGQIWVMLDLSDYLMGHVTSGDTTGLTVTVPVVQAGSAGIAADRNTGLWAHGGFFTDYREGVKTPPSGVVQTGKTHKQGAFA